MSVRYQVLNTSSGGLNETSLDSPSGDEAAICGKCTHVALGTQSTCGLSIVFDVKDREEVPPSP